MPVPMLLAEVRIPVIRHSEPVKNQQLDYQVRQAGKNWAE